MVLQGMLRVCLLLPSRMGFSVATGLCYSAVSPALNLPMCLFSTHLCFCWPVLNMLIVMPWLKQTSDLILGFTSKFSVLQGIALTSPIKQSKISFSLHISLATVSYHINEQFWNVPSSSTGFMFQHISHHSTNTDHFKWTAMYKIIIQCYYKTWEIKLWILKTQYCTVPVLKPK